MQESGVYQGGAQEVCRLCAAVATSVLTHGRLPKEFARGFLAQLPNICACRWGACLTCFAMLQRCLMPGALLALSTLIVPSIA
jgi:hypothetical protein